MRGYRVVHSSVGCHDKGLEVGPLASGPQPEAGLEPFGRHLLETVDAQVHPHAIESLLDGRDNAGLPRARRAVENHDLAHTIEHHGLPVQPERTRKYLVWGQMLGHLSLAFLLGPRDRSSSRSLCA